MGVSIGWFSPESQFCDNVDAICAKIREIVGPTSVGFPFGVSPVMDDDKTCPLAYAVLRGHVPIHVDRLNANQRAQALFTFVLQAENRPVLLCKQADDATSKGILIPDEKQPPALAFGAIELVPGRAVHFDITRYWHGITGYPTGDPAAELPEAVLVQVPHADPTDIAGAIFTMMRVMKRDDRFADMIGDLHGER